VRNKPYEFSHEINGHINIILYICPQKNKDLKYLMDKKYGAA